jgi:uncharacterized protein
MPTNILRKRANAVPAGTAAATASRAGRVVTITAGRVAIRVELADTQTAERIWQQLPLFSTVETWGACIHFETPVETGRERTARLNVSAGDVCYWSEESRVILPFGPTPISRPDEIRLMRPCNIWGRALDDVTALGVVTPGEKISMVAGPLSRGSSTTL